MTGANESPSDGATTFSSNLRKNPLLMLIANLDCFG
jgi:hypothetical protein